MQWNLFDSGDKLKYPWDGQYPNSDTPGGVHYAAHLPRRHLVLPFIFDAAVPPYSNFIAQVIEENPTGTGPLIAGDTIASHYLYAGTKVNDLVFHNKKVARGAYASVQVKTAATLMPVGPGMIVDLATPSWTLLSLFVPEVGTGVFTDADGDGLDDDDVLPAVGRGAANTLFLVEDCIVEITIIMGNLQSSCFALMADLTYFNDQHECACVPPPCNPTYPEPGCAVRNEPVPVP
jgi:hypothetical protein